MITRVVTLCGNHDFKGHDQLKTHMLESNIYRATCVTHVY